MSTQNWADVVAELMVAAIKLGLTALTIFIIYWVAKKLIKFGIEYYFQLKKLNKD